MVNLAGLKWTNHEGGIRVPMIVSGREPSRTESLPRPGGHYDHTATFADLAGVRMPEGKDAVSKNMLLGKPGKLRDYIVIDHTIITGDG